MRRHDPVKRCFDVVFSVGALAFFAPLIVVICIAIKLTMKGPIFYSQWRVGRGGRRFRCYKFRTMLLGAEEQLEGILTADPQLKKEWDKTHKLKNDPRVTPVGRWLRRTSCDELPQFWNVLLGDLSVVGPRPFVEWEVDKCLGGKEEKILSIRPGLTGIWQIYGRSNTSYKLRVRLDEKYIDCRSLALDVKLILQTIPLMVTTKGAY